jgi:hypothetical protein
MSNSLLSLETDWCGCSADSIEKEFIRNSIHKHKIEGKKLATKISNACRFHLPLSFIQ